MDLAKTQRDELTAAVSVTMTSVPRETSALEPSTYTMFQSIIEPNVPEFKTSAYELSQAIGPASILSHSAWKENWGSTHLIRIREHTLRRAFLPMSTSGQEFAKRPNLVVL